MNVQCFLVNTFTKPICCLFLGGNQVQVQQTQDPGGGGGSDGGGRWQVLTQAATSPSPGPEWAMDEDSGDDKPRTRRVACTCPNCSEGGERLVHTVFITLGTIVWFKYYISILLYQFFRIGCLLLG